MIWQKSTLHPRVRADQTAFTLEPRNRRAGTHTHLRVESPVTSLHSLMIITPATHQHKGHADTARRVRQRKGHLPRCKTLSKWKSFLDFNPETRVFLLCWPLQASPFTPLQRWAAGKDASVRSSSSHSTCSDSSQARSTPVRLWQASLLQFS